MKNVFLKKALLICLALVLSLCLVACGSTAPAASSGKASETTYDLSGKEENVDGMTFDGDVIVTGENGRLTFTNCTFNAKVINKGGEGAKVFVWADCTFAKGAECILDSTLKEATGDTDLPKFMIFCDYPGVTCKGAGAVVMPGNLAAKVNGAEYPIDTAEYFVDETTGEFVPYSGQEANMHNFAMWEENGEAVQMHVALFVAE